MIISGIDRLFINVPDMSKALDFYRGIVGMDIAASGILDAKMIKELWGLPKNVSGRWTCVKNKKQATAITLIELKPAPKEAARDKARPYDYGLFDISYFVSDNTKVAQKLKDKGYQFYTEPFRFPTWPSGLESSMGFVFGPARETIGLIQMFNPLPTEEQKLEGDFWIIMDMAQVVESCDEAISFYHEALGLNIVNDNKAVPAGFLDKVLHLPPQTKPRIVLLNNPQVKSPVVESIEFSVKGKLTPGSPDKLGIFLIAFESSDLEADIAAVQKRGFKVLSGPVQIDTPLHGRVNAVNVEGPSKIRVELFQKI